MTVKPEWRDTTAATRARMRASEEKSAAKLRERGWFCMRTGADAISFKVAEGMQLYATNGLSETYRVIGFTDGLTPSGEVKYLPLLEGKSGQFLGIFDYIYTVGPK